MNSDKDIRVLSTPDEPNSWPAPPVYESLWPYERIDKEAMVRADHNGVVSFFTAKVLMAKVANEYDLALSKALFYIWQLEGLLKGKE